MKKYTTREIVFSSILVYLKYCLFWIIAWFGIVITGVLVILILHSLGIKAIKMRKIVDACIFPVLILFVLTQYFPIMKAIKHALSLSKEEQVIP